jgi:hypothetical protein
MGALTSVLTIWVITGILVYLAVMRIVNGEYEIDALIMLITAGLGILVNIMYVEWWIVMLLLLIVILQYGTCVEVLWWWTWTLAWRHVGWT